MIRALRARHRAFVVGLAVCAPGVLAAGLLARRPMPVQEGPLPELGVAPVSEMRELPALFGDFPLRATLGRDASGAAILGLEPLEDLREPDVLVYWTAAPPDVAGVPEGARLLGSLGGTGARHYALPAEARGARGTLLLYSLAHHRTLATAPLEVP